MPASMPPPELGRPTSLDAALGQLYRGELSRSDRWRTRLDTTTNWALTTSAAVISFGIGNPSSPHITVLVGLLLVLTFLLLEARRYRYYDLWIRRVRLLENGYFVPAIRQEPPDADILHELALEIDRPQIQLSLFSAIITRLNRAYGTILAMLIGAWLVKLYAHPTPPGSFREFCLRAHIGPIPGTAVMATVLGLAAIVALLLVASFYTRAPVGELRPKQGGRRVALWEQFSRPYAVRNPRRVHREVLSKGPAEG